MMKLVLEENPIIFPKLTVSLGMLGKRIDITGRKRADYKLSEYLFEAAGGIGIPDIAIFNVSEGTWMEYFTPEFVEIQPKIGNPYKFVGIPVNDNNANMMINFLILHSSATFKII